MDTREYAFYKGDDLVMVGTLEEIAEKTGASVSTIYYYSTKSYAKRAEGKPNVRRVISLNGPAYVYYDKEKIHEAWKQTGLRKWEVGHKMFRSDSFFTKIMAKKGRVYRETLEELADVLGADVEEWIIEEED